MSAANARRANTIACDRADVANENNERFGIADRPACEFDVYFNLLIEFHKHFRCEIRASRSFLAENAKRSQFPSKNNILKRRNAERLGECGISSCTSKCFVKKNPI